MTVEKIDKNIDCHDFIKKDFCLHNKWIRIFLEQI